MKTLKLKIMVRAFKIRIRNGEAFEDIATDYPALTTDDLMEIQTAIDAQYIVEEEPIEEPVEVI